MIKKTLIVLLILLISAGSAAVWWYLPAGNLDWVRDLALIVAIATPVLAFMLWLARRKPSAEDEKKQDQQLLLDQDGKIIRQVFKVATSKIKGEGSRKLASLYELPWYLVIGGEGSSKSTLLKQNNLELVLSGPESESDQDQYLRFWSNDHLVVIELGERLFASKSIDAPLWKVLTQQLLKYRPRLALNGIISVIECDRLVEADKNNRQKLAGIIQEAVLSLGEKLGLDLPVYSVFSKADTLADFVEFFESFSGRDVDNPFGITLPQERHHRFDSQKFDDLSKGLLRSLADQQLELLRHISSEKTGSAVALPYQLRVFFDRINELLGDIGRENRVRKAVWLRGAYLLSCGQMGKEYDLLTQVVAEKAEFNSRNGRDQLPGRRSYFSTRFFSDVILPEKQVTGVNTARQVSYLFGRAAMVSVVALLLAGVSVVMRDNWIADETWRAEATTQLGLYENNIKRLETESHSLSEMIAVLSGLRNVAEKGVTPKPWYRQVSIHQGETAKQVYSKYEEQLQLFLLPKVEELVSNELYVYVNLGNPSKIFEILRYYQMLFDKQRLNQPELVAYLLNNLEDHGSVTASDINSLSALLVDLFNSQYQDKISANNELISVASSNLDGLSPERLIYARLKSLPKYRAQIDVRRQLGEKFDTLFEFSEGFHGYIMPEVYTRQGFNALDLSSDSPMLTQQMKEFKSIQGDLSPVSVTEMGDLSKQIQRLYFADYIYRWQELVNNIHVKTFSSADDLAYTLRLTREPTSGPLRDILGALVINTSLASEDSADTGQTQQAAATLGLAKVAKVAKQVDKIDKIAGDKLLRLQPAYVVNEAFSGYEAFLHGQGQEGSLIPVDELVKQVDGLNTYFNSALTSPSPGKVMLDNAIAHAKGSQDALVLFGRQASQAPGQVSKWVKSIESQAWRQVIVSSAGYLNQQWDERVYQFYVQTVAGRFPFSLQGRGEVAIDDFAQFFKPQGRIDSFVDDMLKPFVYWDNGVLKLNEVDGQTLPISSGTITQLRNARDIRKLFFGQSGQELALQVSLRPSSMSTDVTEFQIKEVENVFSYRHGPRVWSNVNWPSMGLDGYLRTSFYQGDNRIATRSYSGQWALFRTIFDGDSSATSDRRIQKLKYEIEDHKIVLDYTLQDSTIALSKKLFTGFTLPRSL